jgi:hypothetical protein
LILTCLPESLVKAKKDTLLTLSTLSHGLSRRTE